MTHDADAARQLHMSRQGMYEQVNAYHARFIDPSTGLIRAELLEDRACPVCSERDAKPMFIKNGGQYVKCKRCSMCYINPVFTDGALRDYYAANNTAQADAVANESEFYRAMYTRGLEAAELTTPIGRVLDIGCSSGFFLDIAKERGWSTYGIELNVQEFARAQRKSHRVYNSHLESTTFEHSFDLISMWDVFEHIKDGARMLDLLRARLTQDGRLLLLVPNAASLAARTMHAASNMFDGIEHVNLYSPRTIQALATRARYRIESITSAISELHVLRNYLDYEDAYLGTAGDIGPLPFLTEQALHDNLVGYKLLVILRPEQ